MRICRTIFGVLVLGGLLAAAPPAPNYIYNTASYVPPGLPGYGIAQGSFFVLYGANMAPNTIASSTTVPLPTTAGLQGTVVTVTVGGTTVTAPLWYTYAGQIGAIMPSNTPVGSGTLTVTYNGASGTLPVTVVPSAFGIFTFNTVGSGEAVVSFANFTAVNQSNSAMPNQTVILWGTGLGANTGSDALAPTQTNLNTPLTLYVGNIAVKPIYTGRSAFPGVDQINFTIPAGLSGCNVSIVAVTSTGAGNVVSNSATIPIAANGGSCSDANSDFTPAQLSSLSAKSSVNLGSIQLKQTNNGNFNQTGQLVVTSSALAQANFINVTQAQFPTLLAAIATPSIGSCINTITTGANAGQSPNVSGTLLDAGPSLTVTPPSGGPVSLSGGTSHQYQGALSVVVAGNYSASNGSGGAGVGPFNVSFAVPQQITWTNATTVGTLTAGNCCTTISRTKPPIITWSGGDPNGFMGVVIDAGFTSGPLPVDISATCIVPVSAGSFTIPVSVLAAMPNTAQNNYYGSITVGDGSFVQDLTVPGLDGAIAQSQTQTSIPVIFQ